MLECRSCTYCQKCELKNGRYTIKCSKSGEIVVNSDFEQTFDCTDYKVGAVEFPPDAVILPDECENPLEGGVPAGAKEQSSSAAPIRLRFYFKSGAFLDEMLPPAKRCSVAAIVSDAMAAADECGLTGFLSFNDQLVRFADISAAAVVSDD